MSGGELGERSGGKLGFMKRAREQGVREGERAGDQEKGESMGGVQRGIGRQECGGGGKKSQEW